MDGWQINGKLYTRLAGLVESLQAAKPVTRFYDRYFSPTLVNNLVEALLEIIDPAFSYRGVLHLAGSERITDFDYARKLAAWLGLPESLVRGESMAASPTMAAGPRGNSLDVTFSRSLLRTRLLEVNGQFNRIFPQG